MATITGSAPGDTAVRAGVSDYKANASGDSVFWVKRSSVKGDGSWELTLGPGFYVLETQRRGRTRTTTPIIVPSDGTFAVDDIGVAGSSNNSYSGGTEY